MTAEGQPRQNLIAEALQARPQFQSLPENLRGEIEAGIGTIIQQLEESCNCRWNSIGFEGSRIIVFGNDYNEGHKLATVIKGRIKEAGIQCKTVHSMIDWPIKDIVMMIQAGVSTLEELKKFKHQSKFGKSGNVQGRQFRTNPVGPPNQRLTTLR